MVQRHGRHLPRRGQSGGLSRRRIAGARRGRPLRRRRIAARHDGAGDARLLCVVRARFIPLVLHLALPGGPHRRDHHGARCNRGAAARLAQPPRICRRRDLRRRRSRRRDIGHAGPAAASARACAELVWAWRAVGPFDPDQLGQLAEGKPGKPAACRASSCEAPQPAAGGVGTDRAIRTERRGPRPAHSLPRRFRRAWSRPGYRGGLAILGALRPRRRRRPLARGSSRRSRRDLARRYGSPF